MSRMTREETEQQQPGRKMLLLQDLREFEWKCCEQDSDCDVLLKQVCWHPRWL